MARAPCGHDRSRPEPWPLLARRVEERTTQGSEPPQARKRAPGSRCTSLGLQNLWRSGPLWEPPLAKKGPRTWAGTLGYRVPPPSRCLPGPEPTGAAPELMARQTPTPDWPGCRPCIRALALAANVGPHAQTVHVWRGSRGSRSPASGRQGTNARPATGSRVSPRGGPSSGGLARQALAQCPLWPGARPFLPMSSQTMLHRQPKQTSRAVLQQPPRLPKSLGVWCLGQELCPLQPQETCAGVGSSNRHSLRGTEVPDAKGLPTRLLTGAQDTKGGPRRPQGHADLWRHPPGIQSRPVPAAQRSRSLHLGWLKGA